MDRESWLYVLAFLAIVGAGVAFLVPRLSSNEPTPGPEPRTAPGGSAPDAEDVPAVPVEPEAGLPEIAEGPISIELEVAGASGALRGAVRDVIGARTERLGAAASGRERLRVWPEQSELVFGAVGHQFQAHRAEALEPGAVITLPAAAPPLMVRVREPDGTPAADVPVRVLPEVPGQAPRTDDAGQLVLDHLAPGIVVIDLATHERSGPRHHLIAGRDRDVTLALDPPWTITGRFVTPEGKPITGASISAFGPMALGSAVPTDSEGRFHWRGPAVARLALRLRGRGWSPRHLDVRPPAMAPLTTELGEVAAVREGASLEGRVDAAYRTGGAHVLVEPEVAAVVRELFGTGQVLDEALRVPLQEDGSFNVADVPADLPLRVQVRGAGVPVDHRVVVSPGRALGVDLAPPAGWALHGRVLGPDGAPRVGLVMLASYEARDGDARLPDDLVVVTGPDGSFLLRGVAQPTVYVRAYVEGCRSLLKRVALPLARPLTLRLEPALTDATRRVHGRVVDEAGEALEHVTLRAGGRTTRTDADGAFVLEGVESVVPQVTLSYGYEAGTPASDLTRILRRTRPGRIKVTPGGEALRLVLPATGGLRMRVVDGLEDDLPLAFVQVHVRSSRDGRVLVDRGVALVEGELNLPALPAEGLVLALMSPTRRWEGTAVLTPGGVVNLGEVRMYRGLTVKGRVMGPSGAPLTDARVGLFDRGWQSRGADPSYEREQLFRTARTDGQGRFELHGLATAQPKQFRVFRESIDLAVWAAGLAPTTAHIELKPGSDATTYTCEVTLERGSFLSVDLARHTNQVLQVGKAPIYGALIDLEYARDGSDWLDLVHWGALQGPVASDADWRYASQHLLFEARSELGYLVGPVRGGPYRLRITRPGFLPLHRKLTVAPHGMVLMEDLLSGAQRTFEGEISHFSFSLRPDPRAGQ